MNEQSIITKPERKVKVTFTDGYLVDGRVHFGLKASPEMMKSYLQFWRELLPPLVDKIKTAPLEVLPNGLQSANEGLKLLIENKVKGRKVVFRNNNEI